MDAIDPDKPETAPAKAPAADATKTFFTPETGLSQKIIEPTPNANKQKIVYSYITPASTVPLNADRRLFYLGEQPQVLGTFSGSALNPVFNLQQVPVVLSSRSNVAQPDEQQSNKVITENVQKFSQIPPVMASVDQIPQVESKSNAVAQINSVVDDVLPENRVVPTFQPTEDNRALPVVSTEPTVVADVVSDVAAVVPSVVLARNNAIPLALSDESVVPSPVVSSSVVQPSVVPSVVDGVVRSVVEGNDSLQQAVVSPSLKEVEPAVVPSAVAPAVVVDQSVQGSDTVKSVEASIPGSGSI